MIIIEKNNHKNTHKYFIEEQTFDRKKFLLLEQKVIEVVRIFI